MKTLTFLIIVYSLSVYAQEEIWKLGNTFIPVIREKSNNQELLYSKSCEKKKCDALIKSSKIKWADLPKDSTDGGKNPGAVLCKDVLKQTILYAKDIAGNENTFCLFADKSFISSNSLSLIADQNSEKGTK